MPKLTTFTSRETVKARKITNKNGEDVVTTDGSVHAACGAYVVEGDNGHVRIEDGEAFTARYKAASVPRKRASRSAGTKSRAKSPKPADKPANHRVDTDADKPVQRSAAERVKASAAAKSK